MSHIEQQILNRSRHKILEVVYSIRKRPEFYRKHLLLKRKNGQKTIIRYFWFTPKTISYWDRVIDFRLAEYDFENKMIEFMKSYQAEITKLIGIDNVRLALSQCAIKEDYDVILYLGAS